MVSAHKPETMIKFLIEWTERGWLPDFLIRIGIQHLMKERLYELELHNCENGLKLRNRFIEAMQASPIAIATEKANDQHYELPPQFFEHILGPHVKYSCCWWDENTAALEDSEINALKISGEHAQLEDGQEILELGCGWGSSSLWMAENLPNSLITAVTNSSPQKNLILEKVKDRGIFNLSVVSADMNEFSTTKRFDRVVSIEMFEHMRNWNVLFARVKTWLKPEGKFFMHVFCHRKIPYHFESLNEKDWMARYFFSGGIMPCDQLPYLLDSGLFVEQQWRWDGTHYQRTALAWLDQMDRKRKPLEILFRKTYGREADIWWQRWRLFFLAVSELFGYRNGQEWWVSHYRMNCRS